jgi:hypothetical protein
MIFRRRTPLFSIQLTTAAERLYAFFERPFCAKYGTVAGTKMGPSWGAGYE